MFLIKTILNRETMKQLITFFECKFAIKFWSDLRHYCQCSFDTPILNLQSATFGFFQIDHDLGIFLNHILLIYKYKIL